MHNGTIMAHEVKKGDRVLCYSGVIVEVLEDGTDKEITRLVASTKRGQLRVTARCYIYDWKQTDKDKQVRFTRSQARAFDTAMSP